jgi:hypothetical protein
MRTLWIALLLLGGCDGSMDNQGMLRDGLTAAQKEVSLHDARSRELATLPALRDETARHAQSMKNIFAPMHQALGSMSQCQHGAMMQGMMNDLDTIMTDHTSAMGSAADVDRARQECATHTQSMTATIDRMAPMAGDMGCGM